MKKIVCEVCGGNDFVKKDNAFVCQTCGMSYGIADVKRLLVEMADDGTASAAPAQQAAPQEMAETLDNSPVVNTMGSTMAGEDNIKLQYDLYCWHNFYAKCHDLEAAEPFEDDKLKQCRDISNFQYAGSIVERPVTFDTEGYYQANVRKDVIGHFRTENPQFAQAYGAYRAELTAKNNQLNIRFSRSWGAANVLLWIFGVIFTLGAFIGSAVGIGVSIDSIFLAILLGFVIAGVVGFIFIVISAGVKNAKANKYCNLPILSQEEWEKKNMLNTPEFAAYEAEKHDKYDQLMKGNIDYIKQNLPQLVSIYRELNEQIPMPDNYKDEYHVNCLLALVVDRRADTLKEAINLLETENYRGSVLNSLQELNTNLRALDRRISALAELTYQGFATVIKQNSLISGQLAALQYTQQSMFALSMLY